MNGIIVVNKPSDWTSFDVIAKLRGVFKTRKIGHSGTLDPMATGVLPLFVGPAVKAVDMQQNHTKRYTATMLVGTATNTGDITGEALQQSDVKISLEQLKMAAKSFIGEIEQIPPMYSAVKINGQALYKLAREGKTVERASRRVEIFSIEVVEQISDNEFVLDVKCSKGTYIRTLIEDLAKSCGSCATMSKLTRTQSGDFTLNPSYTIEQLQQAADKGILESLLLPVDSIFAHYKRLDIDDVTRHRMFNGAPAKLNGSAGTYRIYHNESFLGLAKIEDNKLTIIKMLVER